MLDSSLRATWLSLETESFPTRQMAVYAGRVAAVAIAYVVGAQLGFVFAFATKQVTTIWPPAGIALAALVLGGPKLWPGVFVGAFLSNALLAEPLPTALGIAFGNTIGPLLGAYVLRAHAAFDPRLMRVQDVVALAALGSALAMAVSASNGVVQLALAGLIGWSDVVRVWWIWWVGDAMGALLVTPVILTLARPQQQTWTLLKSAELAASVLLILAATTVFFSVDIPLAYPVFPLVIWVALRFRQRECALVVLGICSIAVWRTIHGQGPFTSGTLDFRLGMLVTFMAVLSLTGLTLAALAAERRSADTSLKEANAGLEKRVAQRTAALGDANGRLTETNVELRQRTIELARKNEEVEAFVYIVSHDLRAPLVNLQGFARELTLSCSDLEKVHAAIEMPCDVKRSLTSILSDGMGGALRYIGSSVLKFERLIDALLMLSRTGQQSYQIESLNVGEVITATIDSLQQTIDETGLTIDVAAVPNAQGDATAVGQVFANLIGNAIKYRDRDRPARIEIGGQEDDEFVRYFIRDNGVGIPDYALPRVFQVFQRFHPELADGEGIGLAAIKRIIERHGGSIGVESTYGEGSTFSFTLPNIDNGEHRG